jgi:hypothetical protein
MFLFLFSFLFVLVLVLVLLLLLLLALVLVLVFIYGCVVLSLCVFFLSDLNAWEREVPFGRVIELFQQPHMLSKVTPRSASEVHLHWQRMKTNLLLKPKVENEGNRGSMTTSREVAHRQVTRATLASDDREPWSHDVSGHMTSGATDHDEAYYHCWSNDISGHDGSDLGGITVHDVTGFETARLHGVEGSSQGVHGTISGNETSSTSGNETSSIPGNGVDSERPLSVRASPGLYDHYYFRNDLDPFLCPKQDEVIIAGGTTASVPPETLPLRTHDPFQGPFERTQRSVRNEERSVRQTEETCAHPRQGERNGPVRPPMSQEPSNTTTTHHPREDAEHHARIRIRMEGEAQRARIRMEGEAQHARIRMAHETVEDKLRRLEAELKRAMELAVAGGHSQHQHKDVADVIRPARDRDRHPNRSPFETQATNVSVCNGEQSDTKYSAHSRKTTQARSRWNSSRSDSHGAQIDVDTPILTLTLTVTHTLTLTLTLAPTLILTLNLDPDP